MGQSKVNSHRQKKLKQLKRKTRAPIEKDLIQQHFNDIQLDLAGESYKKQLPKSAFLYPTDPEAVFHQYEPAPIVDLRGRISEISGKEFRGSSKKKSLGHIVEMIVYDQQPGLSNINEMSVEQVNGNRVIKESYTKPQAYPAKHNMCIKPDRPRDDADELTAMMGDLKVGGKKNKIVESKGKSAMATENIKGVQKKINKNKIRKNRPKAF